MSSSRLRIIVFWILFVSFLVTVSTVIFYTFGYRFSFDRGIFVYTGSITIKTIPETVNIFIDGNPVPKHQISILNRSAHLTGIMPGEHFLRIESPEHQPWEKKITVRSGISTEFWNIILPRLSFETRTLASGPFVRMFPSPSGRYLALVGEHDSEVILIILDTETGSSKQVFSSKTHRFDPSLGKNLEWAENEILLALPLSREETTTAAIIDRESEQTFFLNETTGFTDIRSVRWDPREKSSVFFLSNQSLYHLDIRNPRAPILLAEQVMGYDLSENMIYFLDAENRILYHSNIGNTLDPNPLTTPIESTANYPILIAYDKDRVAMFDYGGTGLVWNNGAKGSSNSSIIPLGDGIRNLQFSDDGKKLLIATDSEISVLFLREWEVQPARSEGDFIQIARFSTPIGNVQWTEDYEHVIFDSEGSIRLVELDHRDRRNIFTLNGYSSITHVIPNFRENLIYIIGVTKNTENTTLSSFTFPEPQTIFGN